MAIRRFFYVTQDALVVWRRVGTALGEAASFSSSDEGYEQFGAYLQRSAHERSTMLVDVIEEEFATDTIPDLSAADRRSLIARRLKKRFARTPYRLGEFQGKSRRASDRYNVVLSAITNHELVDPWLGIIDEHKVPLADITSVPLIAAALLSEFRKPEENALFLTRHQGGRLRQVFLKSGRAVSARLSRIKSGVDDKASESLVDEIAQSRKYLERSRLLSHSDPLHVYLVAGSDFTNNAIRDDSGIDFQLHIIEPAEAAAKLGLAAEVQERNLEILYLAKAARNRSRGSYTPKNRVNYSNLLTFRHSLIGMAVAGAVACSLLAGVMLTKALVLRNATQAIESQVMRLEETYRRENADFEPIRADSHEMKLAVDTGEFIQENTLPVDWVIREIAQVIDAHPDVFIGELRWEIETAGEDDSSASGRSRADRPMPVAIPTIVGVSANVNGEIRPYDGDLRNAFARIDEFAANLKSGTRFDHVSVIEYPIDARPASAVSGEIRRQEDHLSAGFRLSMTLRIDHEAG